MAGALLAVVGGAAFFFADSDDRNATSRLASIGRGGGAGLFLSGAALSVAALLLNYSANGLERVLEIKSQTESSFANLRRNEERYRMLVHLMTTFSGSADVSGGIDSIQSGWSQYTGQTWEEQRGYGWINAIHPDDRKRVLHLWEDTLRLNCSIRNEYRLWHAASQEYHFCETAAFPMLNEDGTVREWICALRDIDDRYEQGAASARGEMPNSWPLPEYVRESQANYLFEGPQTESA